jgi:hypothetical protein
MNTSTDTTVYNHNDIKDLSAFDINFEKRRTGWQDLNGQWHSDDNLPIPVLTSADLPKLKVGAVINADFPFLYETSTELASPKMGTFGKKYQLVNHLDYFDKQNEVITAQNDLNWRNVKVEDKVYECGAKVQRSIHFLDHTSNFGGNDNVCLRSDTFNSVDQSWQFQQFIGAYRSLCRNTLVFGGERTFHTKKMHTTNLDLGAVIGKVGTALNLFSTNIEQLQQLRSVECTEEQAKDIFTKTLCYRKHRPSEDKSKPVVNKKLLDYLLYRYREDARDLGNTMWLVYNCLTHWSTHTNETFERQNLQANGQYKVVKLKTGRKDQKVYNAQRNRAEIVSGVLASHAWQSKLV